MAFQERRFPHLGKRPIAFAVVATLAPLMLASAGPAQAKSIPGTKGPTTWWALPRPTHSRLLAATTESRAAVAVIGSRAAVAAIGSRAGVAVIGSWAGRALIG